MKYQSLLLAKIRKNILKCCLLKFCGDNFHEMSVFFLGEIRKIPSLNLSSAESANRVVVVMVNPFKPSFP